MDPEDFAILKGFSVGVLLGLFVYKTKALCYEPIDNIKQPGIRPKKINLSPAQCVAPNKKVTPEKIIIKTTQSRAHDYGTQQRCKNKYK